MTKEQFDTWSIPYYAIRMGQYRGAKHVKSRKQANASLRHAKEKGYSSILERFQKEDSFR